MNAAPILNPIPRLWPRDPGDYDQYEIIDGIKVELPPMSADSTAVASELVRRLSNYGIEHGFGVAYTEMLFKLPLPIDRNRRPDVAFVPYSRWPRHLPIPPTNAWDVLPDLCVEVVSPHDLADEIMDQVRDYFQAGVRLVWVVYPRHQLVIVHSSVTSVRGLGRADTLMGDLVLPEFRLPLAELFPEPPATSSSAAGG